MAMPMDQASNQLGATLMSDFSVGLAAKIAAPALAVALSPVPIIIGLILLIHNDRPRVSSLAYLAGRATALTVLVVATSYVPWLGNTARRPVPRWIDWIVVTVGSVFVILGILAWRRRGTATSEPLWHSQLGRMPSAASAALGLFPPLANPKVIAAAVTADHHVAALTSTAGAITVVGCFVALSCSTAALPIFLYLVLGPRIGPQLELLRRWTQRHQSKANAMTLCLVGVIVVLYGLS